MPRKTKVMKQDMGKDEMCHEDWHKHKRMKGGKVLILGLLILANNYWNVVSWPAFIGIVVSLAGIFKLLKASMYK